MAEHRSFVSRRRGARWTTIVCAIVIAAVSACARAPRHAAAPAAPVAPALPPVPLVDGPLAIRVVYPPSGATIQARDSNFIFGTVGSGKATLTINSTPVPVVPNGTFIAFLPLPPPSAPQYTIVAARGGDTVRAVLTIKLPASRPVLADTGRLVVDSASVAPRGTRVARPDDRIRVSVRAPRNASVGVRLADPLLRGPVERKVVVDPDHAMVGAFDVAADRGELPPLHEVPHPGGEVLLAEDRPRLPFEPDRGA